MLPCLGTNNYNRTVGQISDGNRLLAGRANVCVCWHYVCLIHLNNLSGCLVRISCNHSAQSWTSLLSLKSFIVTSSEWNDEPLQAHMKQTCHIKHHMTPKKDFQGTSEHPSDVSSYSSWAFITLITEISQKKVKKCFERKHKMMRAHFSQSRVTISTYFRRCCFQIRR